MFNKGDIVIIRNGAIIGRVINIIDNQYGRTRVTVEYYEGKDLHKITVNHYNIKTLDEFQSEFNRINE